MDGNKSCHEQYPINYQTEPEKEKETIPLFVRDSISKYDFICNSYTLD